VGPAQRAAHVWLDAVTAYGLDEAVPTLDRLWGFMQYVGAVDTVVDVERDTIAVDARPAFGAALLLLETAIGSWCETAGLDRDDAIRQLRARVQEAFAEG
jgi:hypothetical protein